jgi:hypothetical protein
MEQIILATSESKASYSVIQCRNKTHHTCHWSFHTRKKISFLVELYTIDVQRKPSLIIGVTPQPLRVWRSLLLPVPLGS